MSEPVTVHSTFVLERTFTKPPVRVFAALSDAGQKKRWLAEKAEQFDMDFRVGGAEQMQSRLGDDTPFPGTPLTSIAIYQDIVVGQRVVIAQTMSLGGRHISSALVTFELLAEGEGTRLVLTHQAAFYEGSDGPERREGGWVVLLGNLARELA